MDDLAGLVALALVALWGAYLVPHKLRHRQQLLESRADDRFSEALRVVAVSERTGRLRRSGTFRRSREAPAVGSADCGTTSGGSPGLLTPGAGLPVLHAGPGTGGATVDRPTATQDRITADAARRAAQARAARAASVARRAAAARRRAVLAGVLVVATIAGWTIAGLAPAVTWVAGAVPSVLLGGVLVLGRRAVLAGRAADAAWEARMADERRVSGGPRTGAMRAVAEASRTSSAPASAPTRAVTGAQPTVRASSPAQKTPVVERATDEGQHVETHDAHVPHAIVTGRAVHPSEASTEVFARIVEDRGEAEAPARHASTGQTPVVRTGVADRLAKATRDVDTDDATRAPAEDEDGAWSPVPVPRPTYTMKATAPRREPVPLEDTDASTGAKAAPVGDTVTEPVAQVVAEVAEPPAATTGSIDLNAILAKRRAAGE
ncbi:hypothetical protein GXP71_00380 [Cellulomonas sp. H30R-01]|uniref:hypothetical protein n=1 Tax=Cellulomonas sp. H30R-01 TaxID=2704467 RepID=UPI00138D1F54|nr:hypothetical protein [Cellulomonas sp. H30R-01]QHT54708.1 hypothetical protein GXP71_00380 [Cellulomonas sp. H30R-01]